MAYLDACTMKFYSCKFVLAIPFPSRHKKIWERLGRMAVPMRKAVLEETCLAWGLDWASCFCPVRASKLTINQLMRPLPTTRLGSLLAWRSRAHTMRLLLEALGSWAQLHHELHFRVLEGSFCHQWLVPSDVLAFPWWSLEGLLAAA